MAGSSSDKRRINLELSEELLSQLDGMKAQMGFRNRGLLVEQLLRELLLSDDKSDEAPCSSDEAGREELEELPDLAAAPLDESSALVLIESALVAKQVPPLDQGDAAETEIGGGSGVPTAKAKSDEKPGIQLPGFVRRQAREMKRSLEETPKQRTSTDPGLTLVDQQALQQALDTAHQHWLEVYGQPPTDAVVDAALSWLARDIWPQSDHSDGRPFSWSLAQQVILSVSPSWSIGEPSLSRVITAAGILEDPFSGSTLALRVPTLVTRFVQRQRSRNKRSTSFEAMDQTMNVHAALRLLELSTAANRPYTLKEIREAYREQAQSHHPDAGGSPEAMRRLNEAYQFLKDRYRRSD